MAKNISKTGRQVRKPLTAKRKAVFLDELRRHGIVAEASRCASPHSRERHGAASTFRQERNKGPEFAALWDAAQEEADAKLLMECRRRAVEGTDRGIFQKGGRVIDHDGEPATEKVYSDRLMELLLKARFPNEFIERRAVEHSGNIDHTMVGMLITPADLLVLNLEQRDALQGVLEVIAVHRGELEGPGERPMAMLPANEVEVVS